MSKTRISRGKFNRMQQLSNQDGVIAALAIDQRGSMVKMLKASVGEDKYNIEMAYEFKELVSEELTKYVSAILLDEELGFKGMAKKNANAGLILSYEKTGYDVNTPGRLPELLAEESLQRLIKKGADAAKVLVYYNPDDPKEVQDKKHAFLERLGEEARAADIPVFVEPIVYDNDITDDKSPEFAKIKPRKVIETIREFTKPQYHIDILKVEVPVLFNYVDGFNEGKVAVYSQKEAAQYFKQASDIATRPFIYLSAGVPTKVFHQELRFAGEHGAKYSGILGGRATWFEGVDAYAKGGRDGLRKWLDTVGRENVETLNQILKEFATPWYDTYGGLQNIEVFDSNL
ncbi:tagatose 1,6-diphosphate aldolase [Zophobihabitans entericus]|uniref:tagatose-bisphosphate aldolase n=1 Tax=Zophobihabitans entericus TaxID=1635327 RepID=A0A6G9I7M8_9GAMM|nr:tagatose 1,6-diphosphate aldolase [Zophobihabitans entericus]QIQ20213.1 tagatose 1,6-diphosphate aldolase [Zophobihabitans entericus]